MSLVTVEELQAAAAKVLPVADLVAQMLPWKFAPALVKVARKLSESAPFLEAIVDVVDLVAGTFTSEGLTTEAQCQEFKAKATAAGAAFGAGFGSAFSAKP